MRKLIVLVFTAILIIGIVTSAKADQRPLNYNKTDSKPKGTTTPVPEPTTIALFGAGLLGLYGLLKKKEKD